MFKKFLTKQKELVSLRAESLKNWQDLSAEERRVAKQKEREELENWAEENNIDLKYLFPRFGSMMGFKKGWGMGGHMGWWK